MIETEKCTEFVRLTKDAHRKLETDAFNDPKRPKLGTVASALILAGKWPVGKRAGRKKEGGK